MNRLLTIPRLCGAIPLVTGSAVFCLWLVTGWDWLCLAGYFTILGGFVLFAAGAGALVRYHFLSARTPGCSPRSVLRRTLGAWILLLGNFPAAAAFVMGFVVLVTRCVVIVHNGSDAPLTEARLVGGGCNVVLGDVPAHGETRRTFWIQSEGTLELRGTLRRAKVSHEVGYVTAGLGERFEVTIAPEGGVSVRYLDSPWPGRGKD